MRAVVATAVGVAAAVGLLTGCSSPPGAAAVVDGRVISESYLDDSHTELSGIGVDRSTLLSLLIAAPYFIDAAEANGVGVSEAEARTLIEDGLDDGHEVSAGTVEFIRFRMAIENIASLPDGGEILDDVDRQVLALPMSINPRYGDIDRQTGRIAITPLPWIVSE